jgi:NADPH-dependent 2,4-dienoyl-CoA reductase/sulfur reductase-like enzyme/peroxiredoxin family protein/rhodanese-related sulfurtransferase/TusA-related sulfurtransferase
MKKILIVGGVAGGASFAARMRRLDETAELIMFEKGEYISFANCGLPYHIEKTIKDRENLIIQTPKKFKDRFNVDVRTHSEVIAIDKQKKCVTVRTPSSTYEETYDYLVLSPGAAPIRPPVPGIDSEKIYTLRTIPDMDRIKSAVDAQQVKRAAVIGGGFIGLEMAEALRHRDIDVTLVELADQVFMPADHEMAQILHQHLELNSVRLLLGVGADGFNEKTDGTIDIILKGGKSLNVDMVILAIGVKPDTQFIKASGIAVNDRGLIIVDNKMRTDAENVFAVGDAIEVTDFVSGKKVHLPLAGPANRQARIAADVIAGYDSVYKNTQGTAICKIFDITAAVTGLNEKNAKRFGIAYQKSYTHSASHAGYYPGSFPMSLKVLFAPDTGKLLGAQVIGKLGIDKRIDVFATAIRHGLTVDDLTDLELSYAPPYGSARDAVNIAGLAAQNIKRGIMPVWFPDELDLEKNSAVLLDVRTVSEFEMGSIENAVNIPVDELRARMWELDKNREILVFCQVGLRGHVATRMLLQNGFKAKNLSGGYKTYTTFKKTAVEAEYLQPVSQPVCSSPSGQTLADQDIVLVDACGLQCPGPILKLKTAVDAAKDGQHIRITATDQGFTSDIPSWCTRTGNSLITLGNKDGIYEAVIKKGKAIDVCKLAAPASDKKTMVIFSNDLDKMLAAFIIANGAASMGSHVTLFFTFWGLNLLRKNTSVPVKKNMVESMFGMMMPRGAKKVILSKMHMGGMGTKMMQMVMKNKNIFTLEELMAEARKNNIRFVACSMSMDVMGIKKEELIDGVEIGGVAAYLQNADESSYNLFI